MLFRKVKETGEVDSDGNPIELFDVEKDGDDEMGDESMAELKEETQHKRSRKAKIRDGIATEGNEIEAKLKPKRSRKSATKKVTAEMIEATGPTNGDEAEGSTAKPEEAPVEMPKKASRTMAKKAAEQVMEGIDAKAGEEAGGSTAKLEETSTVKPKKARKSMTKKVAEEVVEGIDAKAGEEANAPLEKILVDKPKKPRKSATKQVVEEVMEEIEAEMKTETEEVERMEGTEAVRAPQKKRGRRSTAAQLA